MTLFAKLIALFIFAWSPSVYAGDVLDCIGRWRVIGVELDLGADAMIEVGTKLEPCIVSDDGKGFVLPERHQRISDLLFGDSKTFEQAMNEAKERFREFDDHVSGVTLLREKHENAKFRIAHDQRQIQQMRDALKRIADLTGPRRKVYSVRKPDLYEIAKEGLQGIDNEAEG